MEHTWQSHHLPRLETSNLEKGDVVVCGSIGERAPHLAGLDPDRVAFVAPLDSRSDLEWLLRGLHLHPNVRHLVVCGDDRRGTGASLLALWRDGLDGSGRLAGSRGRLSAELDAACVDALRSDVSVWDWRGRPLAEIASGVRELAALPREREPRPLPNPVIPRRKVFLSRKTSFPIFSNDVADSWLQLLNLAMRIGSDKHSADGERIAEALNAVVTIGLPVIAEDLERQQVPESGEFPSYLDFDRDDFERYYRSFAKSPPSGGPGPGSGPGGHSDEPDAIDPIEALCERLERSVDDRAEALGCLGPDDLGSTEAAPHLVSATFDTVDGELFGSFVLRSADLYTDWPFEAMALVRLQRELAGRLGLAVGAATFVIHSARLRERDWERTLRLLEESFERPLPLQVDHAGIFLFGNDGGEARAMLLDHDAGTIFWEDAFGSAEDLSWYIVDAMPWLLPQHIRYVGQECAALARAMREDECYLQG